MRLVVIALANLLLSGIGITLIFNGVSVPEPTNVLIIGSVGTLFYYGFMLSNGIQHKQANRIMLVAVSMYMSIFLSSVLYSVWTFDLMFSALVMAKGVLFLLILLSLYGNVLYMRAVSSYKKKRGNQRIKEPPKESVFSLFRKHKNESNNKEVYLILGESAENEAE